MSFKHDFNSIRTKKTVNGVATEFTYVGDMLVSQKTGNEIINFAYTAGGAPYGFTFNGTSYFYLLNLQGNIIGIYDSNGNVVVEYTYDSWGKLISITGSLADTVGIKNPLRYRGYYYDTETSLYYLQSRYYDPETCRFINMDAYFIAGDYFVGKDMYAYCLNNPIMYVDPTGYNSEDLYKFLASFAMLCGLANVGFVWWEPIIESDFSYEVIYGITEDVGNTLNWFYSIYDYEINIDNSRRLMSKVTDMCTAIGQEIGVAAIDVMSIYFTADKIGLLFELHGDNFFEKVIFLSAGVAGSLATLGIASITSGGAATIGALVLSGIEAAAGSTLLGFSVVELVTWIEILSLENYKS